MGELDIAGSERSVSFLFVVAIAAVRLEATFGSFGSSSDTRKITLDPEPTRQEVQPPTATIIQLASVRSWTKNTTGMAARPSPSSPGSDDHSTETPFPAALSHAASQTSSPPSPTASSPHKTSSLFAPPPATVTPDPTTSPLESPANRPQQVAPPIDRWEASPSVERTRSTTSERLGDHTARRYRQFRQFVDSQGEELDTVLFGMLLSGEGLCDEIRAFEEASSLLRLAQTGYLVRKLRQLHELLDSVALTYAMRESEDLSNWETALEAERAGRVERYDVLLKVLLENGEEGGANIELDCDALDEWDMIDEILVEEVLTMLTAGVDKYAHDVLTRQETQTIMAAFRAVSMHSTAVVVTTPEWFVSPFEFGGTYGLGRWGNDLLFPDNSDSERFIAEANIWSGLNHPHIAKFLGACHVGSRPFFAHEKVRTLSEYLRGLTDRQPVWSRLYELALGVQYLHERGLGCGQLDLETVYCARFEDKTLLLGIGLVKSATEATAVGEESGLRTNSLFKLVCADVRSLLFCILDALSYPQKDQARILDEATKEMNAISDRALPTNRPHFVTVDEWSVLEPMFKGESEVNMLAVLDRLGSLAGNEERDAFGDMTNIAKQLNKQVIDLGEIVILSNGLTLREVLEKCERLVVREPSCAQIHARLSNVLEAVHQHNLGGMDSNGAKDMVGHVCGLVVRFYRFLYQKSTSAASSLAGWNRREPAALFSFHTGIDHWIEQYSKSIELNPVHDWQPSWHHLQSSRQSLEVQQQNALVQSNNEEGETYCEFERMHLYTTYSTKAYSRDGSAQVGSHEPPIDISKQSSLPRWLIPPYEVDYHQFDALGEGSFGTVYRGRWFETPVVVKRMSTTGNDKRAVQQQFRREADVWFGLNHINVIKMYGACHVGQPFFVCEYASGGELMSFLEREGRDLHLIWYCLLNAALGLQYLHDADVVHGDLKADNILVGADRNVKLADFGLSLSKSARSRQGAAGSAVGAYRWKAPECIPAKDDPGLSPTFASDVFSFAMCIIEVVSGEFPWGEFPDAAVKYHVKRGTLPKRPNNLEDSEWKLIERMCCFDPTKRVSIGAVVAHLSALLQRLEMEQLWSSIYGIIPFKSCKNRIVSRDGALLILLKLVTSTNTHLAKMAEDYVISVNVNRGAGSDSREVEMIVNMLTNESNNVKTWASRVINTLCENYDGNKTIIVAMGGVPALVKLINTGTNLQKEYAATAIANLSMNAETRVAIAAEGGIPALLNSIRDGTERQKEYAAFAIRNLTVISENRVTIAAEGGIPVLITLIRDGNDLQKEYAAFAVERLSLNCETSGNIAAEGGIPALLDLIRVGIGLQRDHGVIAIAFLSVSTESKLIIAAEGGISTLIGLTQDGTDLQKKYAAIAIGNLSVNVENNMTIGKEGGIPALLNLIRVGADRQKTYAAFAISRLASIDANRTVIGAEGGVSALLELARGGTDRQKKYATAALWNQSANGNTEDIVISGAIPLLLSLVRGGKRKQKENAAGVLWNLAYFSDSARRIITALGGVESLLQIVTTGTGNVVAHAAGVLAFIGVDDSTKAVIIAHGGISSLLKILDDAPIKWKDEYLVALLALCASGDTNVRFSFENANGVAILSALASSDIDKVRDLSRRILIEVGFAATD